MATIHLTARELREHDPSEFEREYYEWQEYAGGYEWWDFLYDVFKEDMAKFGVWVEDITFRLAYSQGDGAAFIGRINFSDWMKCEGYAEKYPVLYLDARAYGAYANPRNHHHSEYISYVNLEYSPGNCYPEGVFADLPQADWDELAEEQYAAEDWEKLLVEWCRDKADDLYHKLVAEYEYLTSEDAFIESCEANEVTFEIEGEES